MGRRRHARKPQRDQKGEHGEGSDKGGDARPARPGENQAEAAEEERDASAPEARVPARRQRRIGALESGGRNLHDQAFRPSPRKARQITLRSAAASPRPAPTSILIPWPARL